MIRTFLFFDNWMMDDMRDVERCFGTPQPEGPLITGEFGENMRTLEMPGDQWPTKWRMWYANPPEPEERSEPGRNPMEYFCLAESDDGFEWRRANIPKDKRPYPEYPNAAFEHGAKEVRYDPWDIPERRYKAGFNVRALHDIKPWHAMIMGWSADGAAERTGGDHHGLFESGLFDPGRPEALVAGHQGGVHGSGVAVGLRQLHGDRGGACVRRRSGE